MANPILTAKHFQDEEAAFAYVEAALWPDGPYCPHCGSVERISKMQGKSTRIGLYKCYSCRKPFTVRMGTIFESSHVPLHLWLQAMHLICSSKKGISSNQLHRTLGITLKSAWFLSHRIREAMRDGSLAPMGGAGGIVEIDETFIGRKLGTEVQRGSSHKNVVLTLVEREGSARSFHVASTRKEDVLPIVRANIAREARVMSDEAVQYAKLGDEFEAHGAVDHGREEWAYIDRDTGIAIHINSAEGYYSIFKRGMKGVYQHCAEKHLHRYLAEFDFRYSNRIARGVDDAARASRAPERNDARRRAFSPHMCKLL
jgi:transposase-like protein